MKPDLGSDAPRALVTGLTGFTGRYLARKLEAAGYRVFGMTYRDGRCESNVVSLDLCDRDAVARAIAQIQPDVVAHLAAISFVAHGDVNVIYRTNIVGTRNLLEALADLPQRPHAVLLASSANIYGNSQVEIIDESVVANPANDYAVSKLSMEYMASLWRDKLPIIITRPFNYTGVGQAVQFLLPKIVSHFQRGERIIELGNLDVERDFSDVRMVADAYLRLLQQEPTGGIYNICSGKAVSLQSIIAMMEDVAGYSIEVRVNPAFVRANEVKRLQGDASKLIDAIGAISQPELQETLRWMYVEGRW